MAPLTGSELAVSSKHPYQKTHKLLRVRILHSDDSGLTGIATLSANGIEVAASMPCLCRIEGALSGTEASWNCKHYRLGKEQLRA